MTRRLFGAFAFLTTIPLPERFSSIPPGQTAVFFPLVGAALGAIGAFVYRAASALFPAEIAALTVIALWALLTAGLHEDGFADVADAFRAGRSRDRILAILKDSRIGAHGALSLIVILLLRWQALVGISVDPMPGLAGVLAVSRASMVVLAWMSPPCGSGLGYEFSRTLTSPAAMAVALQAAAFAYLSGKAVLFLWGATLIVVAARAYFLRRIGGVTGDCLGATCLLVETWGLMTLSCQHCM